MLDIVKSPDFDKYFGLIKNHGLWSIQFFENWCIVTQLPKIIRRDDKTRLHSSDSPTIEWRNGQKDYWIHGIYIPKIEEWEHIVSGNMSFKEIMQESNQEKRRAILEEIGSDKLFDLIPKQYVRLLSSEKGYNLYNISKEVFNDDRLIEDMRLLTYSCPSTNRKYADTVPIIDQENNIELNTAMDAIAWKFHKTRKEYIELLRIES